MRSNVKTTTVVAAVGVFLLLASPGVAGETITVGQSPELKELGRFVGSWTWKVTSRKAEWTRVAKVFTFDHKVEWILGGRMIQHKWVWTPGDEKIHCTSLMGYDAKKEHYTEWHFDSTGVVPEQESHRTWNESTKTFTGIAETQDGITMFQINRFIDDNTMEWTMVIKDSAGKIMADMEGTAKRR